MDTLRDVFLIIGIIYTLIILMVVIYLIGMCCNDYLLGVKHRYRQRRRFDKPPTAKCYCVDCEYYSSWDENNYTCVAHNGWFVADNWFCWSATPKKLTK